MQFGIFGLAGNVVSGTGSSNVIPEVLVCGVYRSDFMLFLALAIKHYREESMHSACGIIALVIGQALKMFNEKWLN